MVQRRLGTVHGGGQRSCVERAPGGRRGDLGVSSRSAVRFIEAKGLRMILRADARAGRGGGRVVLVRGPESVHRAFPIALLDRRLDLLDDAGEIAAASGG